MMVKGQLKKLNPYTFPCLLWKAFELLQKILMFAQHSPIIFDIPFVHFFKYYKNSKLSKCISNKYDKKIDSYFNIVFVLIKMDQISYEEIAEAFRNLRQSIMKGATFRMTTQELEEEQVKCASLLEDMSNSNNYEHFQEVVGYQDKYKQIKNVVQEAKNNSFNQECLAHSLKNVFGRQTVRPPSKGIPQVSEISQIKTSEVMVPDFSRTLEDFLKKKQSEVAKKQISFKKILDSKVFQSAEASALKHDSSKHSRFSKSHLKKDQEKQGKLKGVIDQHKKALHKLQHKVKQEEELNDFQKNLLREQKNRYLGKIQELEEQIQQLYRDNYRLRELQKTGKDFDTFNMTNINQKSSQSKLYEPYVIKTRNNDLNKINEKNYLKEEAKMKQKARLMESRQHKQCDYLGDKLQREKPVTAHQFFGRKSQPEGLYLQKYPKKQREQIVLQALLGDSFEHAKSSVKNSQHLSRPNDSFEQNRNKQMMQSRPNQSFGSINNGSRFDTFHMANTLSYINDDVLGQSRNVARITSETSTRNKVAFFKNSLVLIRSNDYDIAYKRSDLSPSFDKVRLIFYVNNKSSNPLRVNIKYEYQHQYFNFDLQQKIGHIAAKSQGREVVEVTLISKIDLNGVTDMHIEVGDTVYDLWLPVNFIKFKQSSSHHLPLDAMEMIVLPDRQFASFSNLQEIVPVMFGGRDSTQTWAYLHGQCKFGSFTVKLTWRLHDLIIETTQKWLDYLAFIFHFFK